MHNLLLNGGFVVMAEGYDRRFLANHDIVFFNKVAAQFLHASYLKSYAYLTLFEIEVDSF